jgi:hypothetical protein
MALVGSAGYGKTQMARKVAQEFETHFPDGAMEVQIGKSQRRAESVAHSLKEVISHFDSDLTSMKNDVAKLRRKMLGLLNGKRVLLILENPLSARIVEQ